jgi:mRNA interferase HicA
MKRRDLIHYLKKNGCQFLREGGNHTLFINRKVRKATTIPRHQEIDEFLVRKICRDLEIPEP